VKWIRSIRRFLYAGITSIYFFVAILIGYVDQTQKSHFWLDEIMFLVAYALWLLIVYIMLDLFPVRIRHNIQRHRVNRQKEVDLQNEQDLWDTIR